ncbi:MAG: hypothetical protein IBX63_04700 [Coriobacteriia bacterium]|nr:hypothetical protein [Coriobacteriia bacterium]
MARGTKLFQAPRSPLIQGRSRTQRPWWQPYLVSVALGLAWPVASLFPVEFAAQEDTAGVGDLLSDVLVKWFEGLPVLVPAVLLGAAAGVMVAGGWGIRYRWIPGMVGAVSAWYLALVLLALFG